jgi:hypothetical protein
MGDLIYLFKEDEMSDIIDVNGNFIDITVDSINILKDKKENEFQNLEKIELKKILFFIVNHKLPFAEDMHEEYNNQLNENRNSRYFIYSKPFKSDLEIVNVFTNKESINKIIEFIFKEIGDQIEIDKIELIWKGINTIMHNNINPGSISRGRTVDEIANVIFKEIKKQNSMLLTSARCGDNEKGEHKDEENDTHKRQKTT